MSQFRGEFRSVYNWQYWDGIDRSVESTNKLMFAVDCTPLIALGRMSL